MKTIDDVMEFEEYDPNQTRIKPIVEEHRTHYKAPVPTSLMTPDKFESLFGKRRGSGAFGTVTQNPRGGVSKVLAASVHPPVPSLKGTHFGVKVDHIDEKNYVLRNGVQSIDFTLSQFDHLHVVSGVIEGVILRSLQGVKGVVSYRDREFVAVDGDIFILTKMDEAPGEPTNHLMAQGLSLESALQISYDAAMTLQEIHDNDIVHGDIKPANIMSDGTRTTITDFGNSRLRGLDMYPRLPFREDNEASFVLNCAKTLLNTRTPAYAAPEVVFDGPSVSGDTFSMTTTALYLLTGGMIVAPAIASKGWESISYLTKEIMLERGIPDCVQEAIQFNLNANPKRRDLGRLVYALGTALGTELPPDILVYTPLIPTPTHFPSPQNVNIEQLGLAMTEFPSTEKYLEEVGFAETELFFDEKVSLLQYGRDIPKMETIGPTPSEIKPVLGSEIIQ
ncbi:hypothetical protein HOL21_03000 [Candidatus Woesearchaeota archaeon]|jgi:serine/threonine protein kinase|nr:hypothetical protein [Candidatus Woesearchaeota archaeon]MBT5397155.1 hypothetical protein [Candidatus Woesearchaeota archaeon]MBT5924133.1 hypothetical protein [Candidatus Woesearchaeota archaeon]MBT6367299.1 hypothetical protein [Candidatus Woesearchaeota archaeon]MBT7762555.1 hypothetical protein [Candidatus Woesearchaeota archaeon]